MDCVEGKRGEGPMILTLLFRRFSFQIMMLLRKKSQQQVTQALDSIEHLMGLLSFKRLFGTVLTDRGSEFLDYPTSEKSVTRDAMRCRVYYCDPMKSGQKGRCERNHVEPRKILPKGSSFTSLTPREVVLVSSHVNSYGCPALGGASPYQLAKEVLPEDLLDWLGMEYIEPDKVIMKPALLKL